LDFEKDFLVEDIDFAEEGFELGIGKDCLVEGYVVEWQCF